jgi:rRNA maturation RNase YbeY
MRILNRRYRGLDKTTDVLSFPLLDAEAPPSNMPLPLGDIVVNLHKAKRQAEEYGVSFNEELKRLLIHGLVHLIGYDHEKSRYQKIRMEAKERELFDLLK